MRHGCVRALDTGLLDPGARKWRAREQAYDLRPRYPDPHNIEFDGYGVPRGVHMSMPANTFIGGFGRGGTAANRHVERFPRRDMVRSGLGMWLNNTSNTCSIWRPFAFNEGCTSTMLIDYGMTGSQVCVEVQLYDLAGQNGFLFRFRPFNTTLDIYTLTSGSFSLTSQTTMYSGFLTGRWLWHVERTGNQWNYFHGQSENPGGLAYFFAASKTYTPSAIQVTLNPQGTNWDACSIDYMRFNWIRKF